jgi:hypothetical protein
VLVVLARLRLDVHTLPARLAIFPKLRSGLCDLTKPPTSPQLSTTPDLILIIIRRSHPPDINSGRQHSTTSRAALNHPSCMQRC